MKIEVELSKGYVITSGTEKVVVSRYSQILPEIKRILREAIPDSPKKEKARKQEKEPEPASPKPEKRGRRNISSLLIDAFDYSKFLEQVKSYKNVSFVELPDGRVMLSYLGSHYYTTKQKLDSLPKPLSKGYLRNKGLSTNAITAVNLYLKYCSLQKIAKATESRKAPDSSQEPVKEG